MKINILNKFQARFYFSRLEKRTGICSKESNGENHMLLWDFDNENFEIILRDLKHVMHKHNLPKIYILKTSQTGYHAYCFTKRSFRETIIILAETSCIDFYYFKLGIIRGYYTLRFSGRKDGKPVLIKTIPSVYPEEMSHIDMTINEYYTSNKGFKNAKR